MSTPDRSELAACLAPTRFIESSAPAIVELGASLRRPTPRDTAVALFDWVRDHVRYESSAAGDPPEDYRATRVLERRTGYCIQKAVLLCALGRASGIPTRLGFADVRNHRIPEHLRRRMGTNLFVFHGYVEFFLDGRWVKATPTFDPQASRKAGVLPVELDGTNDAMLQPVDPEGHPFIEYVRHRGSYVDLPMGEIRAAFHEVYARMIERE